MTRSIVEFHGVTKVYRTGLLRRRSLHALRDVTLAIPQGSVFGLLGPNRAGKTTLVKCLLSLCRPTSGTVERFGWPAADRSTLARVGYLHECQAFPRYLKAAELLHYYGRLSLVPRDELARRIPQLLDQVGLADRTGEPIATFSKGMAQRLALAQALVNDPELLVLDEPTEGMDLSARKLLHRIILGRRDAGNTVILVSHSMTDVRRLCDRVAVLREGRLAFCGPLAELTGDAPADDSADALQDALEPMYAGASA
jgi:ABC-2 type transport system ATP-binding protein